MKNPVCDPERLVEDFMTFGWWLISPLTWLHVDECAACSEALQQALGERHVDSSTS